jgi:hypothetical protein
MAKRTKTVNRLFSELVSEWCSIYCPKVSASAKQRLTVAISEAHEAANQNQTGCVHKITTVRNPYHSKTTGVTVMLPE